MLTRQVKKAGNEAGRKCSRGDARCKGRESEGSRRKCLASQSSRERSSKEVPIMLKGRIMLNSKVQGKGSRRNVGGSAHHAIDKSQNSDCSWGGY